MVDIAERVFEVRGFTRDKSGIISEAIVYFPDRNEEITYRAHRIPDYVMRRVQEIQEDF